MNNHAASQGCVIVISAESFDHLGAFTYLAGILSADCYQCLILHNATPLSWSLSLSLSLSVSLSRGQLCHMVISAFSSSFISRSLWRPPGCWTWPDAVAIG
ncbi:hypothetical protein VTN77DRAFT_1013 [Rasamsonia byssochlamydoides]|uniref:uncharacterized protein n=1 Tax=Rasamsonia byssochlamydoides TaxID=89139 RepID=UPI003742B0DC